MLPKSKAQARWAREGCPGSGMTHEKCEDFVPHGKGSMKRLPERSERGEHKKKGR